MACEAEAVKPTIEIFDVLKYVNSQIISFIRLIASSLFEFKTLLTLHFSFFFDTLNCREYGPSKFTRRIFGARKLF